MLKGQILQSKGTLTCLSPQISQIYQNLIEYYYKRIQLKKQSIFGYSNELLVVSNNN